MQLATLASVLALATSALAITVTEPSSNQTWDVSNSNTIKWTSVSTDPKTVRIVLVEENVTPQVKTTLINNTTVSAGSYTVNPSSLCKLGLANGKAYQVNLLDDKAAILAQSQQFSVTGAAKLASSCETGQTTSAGSSSTTSSTSSSTASAASASKTNAASAVEAAVGLGAIVFGAAVAVL